MIQYVYIIFFKQKTAYEMRIRDWSSDVCSADLDRAPPAARHTDLPGSRGAEERRPRRGDLRRLATDVLLAARRRLLPRLARPGLRPPWHPPHAPRLRGGVRGVDVSRFRAAWPRRTAATPPGARRGRPGRQAQNPPNARLP